MFFLKVYFSKRNKSRNYYMFLQLYERSMHTNVHRSFIVTTEVENLLVKRIVCGVGGNLIVVGLFQSLWLTPRKVGSS